MVIWLLTQLHAVSGSKTFTSYAELRTFAAIAASASVRTKLKASTQFAKIAIFCERYEISRLVFEDFYWGGFGWSFHGVVHDQDRFLYDKVTVLESEKRSWESSPEAQAIRDALNPWRNHDSEANKRS